MCGICGFVTRRNITIEQLTTMIDTITHRGPNDRGTEIYSMRNGMNVGMAQRRLSIVDLSSNGHQPMTTNDGRVSIVFNGEIYNFRSLKEELSKEYQFISTCDTEVILASYLKWGIDCVNHLNGMFAFSIFDRKDDSFYLVRDRIGKKPMYYWWENEELVFASELKPIMACPGFTKRIRTDILSRYLCQQYILHPDTIFENVYKLEPGTILKLENNSIEKIKYWDVSEVYSRMSANQIKDYSEAKQVLKDTLMEAVSERLFADVPVGTFLSGGYDSSLISALAVECSSAPVKTYCIGFDSKEHNEAIYAKEIAKHLDTNHTEMYITESDMFDLVDSIAEYYDEPFADSSQIPTMLVSKMARKDVTVVLSGDGGDEFFCGYGSYDKIAQSQKLDVLGGMVYGITKPLHLLDKLPNKAKIIASNRDKETKTQLNIQHYISQIGPMALDSNNQIDAAYKWETKYQTKNWQTRRMLLDMDAYLPGDILCKVDRASMRYSLETRCPILDTRVMELSYRIPHKFKYMNGDKKHILKDLAYDYIPRELLERPKKGFAVPMEEWLTGPLKDRVLTYAEPEYLRKQGIFNPEYSKQFIDMSMNSMKAGRGPMAHYSPFVWAFLVFQMWYDKWM